MSNFTGIVRSLEWHYGWWDIHGEQGSFQLWYHLTEGPRGRGEVQLPWPNPASDRGAKMIALARWALNQIPSPPSYKIGGKEIRPVLALDVLHVAVFGQTEGTPSSMTIATWIWHPDGRKESGPHKTWSLAELPQEIQELARSFDDAAWSALREDLNSKYQADLPSRTPPLTYIAYRGSEGSEAWKIAKALADFLNTKGIRPWFFHYEVGWADSQTLKMQEGIQSANAGICIITSDFLEGPTAKEEFTALFSEMKDRGIKLGAIRVGNAELPPFLKDRLWVKTLGSTDPENEKTFTKIYRGLLGLPIMSPNAPTERATGDRPP